MKRSFLMLALVAGGTLSAGLVAAPREAEARVCVARHHDIRGTCARWAPGWGPGAMRPMPRPGWAGLGPYHCRWVAVAVPTPWGVRVERRRVCR
ncbi:MAG: hypothetical protein ACOVLI_05805 [Rhabdaerophilum sp.]|jgi:hypothetical protein